MHACMLLMVMSSGQKCVIERRMFDIVLQLGDISNINYYYYCRILRCVERDKGKMIRACPDGQVIVGVA